MKTEYKWKAEEIKGAHRWEITAQTSETTWEVIALVYACIADDGDESKVEERAKLICSAVNCHDELVGVIEAYIEMHLLHRLAMPETNENEGKRWKRTLDNAQAILSKAKGEA